MKTHEQEGADVKSEEGADVPVMGSYFISSEILAESVLMPLLVRSAPLFFL